ncbi:BamA/TamA family outer membrane protein [Mucilaginibacter sp. JRF]|uniref:BamA/TamA family outer membrane protein n=1 Tax=Mucilaginibacter sp. JRF TaxID=2780088 RepID=UPI0018800EE5|nr:BamA/TamA family outer membrane protein [Mucilaginibacter sp. JRF]MBE9584239.1 BamA/TamA family outer membrane protein [Mucilaginibacter sp. JRF]
MRNIIFTIMCVLPVIAMGQTANSIIPDTVSKQDTAQQTDLLDVAKSLFNINSKPAKPKRGKKLYFSLIPFGGNVPGANGRALMTSTTASIYFGPMETTTASTATFAPYWNLKGRFGLPLRTSIWLAGNSWTIQGDTRFLHYPQLTWGLGSANKIDENTLVNYNYIRFYQSALKQLRPYLFAGFGYNLDFHSNIKSDDQNVDLSQFTNYAYGTNGSSVSSGVAFNVLYDTRNNTVNPLPGAYANIIYRVNPKFLGSNQNWTSLYIDVRKYVPVNPERPLQQNTLAFWSYLWTAFNGNAPFLDLPSIGWDPYNRSGRGIDQNRYRGRTLFYLESEYRRDITRNGLLGFVVFANANTVSGSGSLFKSWHPAAGTGLRIKFSKASGTNIGIDYGVSKGYSAILLNLGEAF